MGFWSEARYFSRDLYADWKTSFKGQLFFAFVVVAAFNAIGNAIKTRGTATPEPSVQQKIDILADNLKLSAATIKDIENEVNVRAQILAKLQRDADTAQKLADLNKDKADAVARALQSKLDEQEKKAFWKNQAWTLSYTLLGVVLGELYRVLRRKWRGEPVTKRAARR